MRSSMTLLNPFPPSGKSMKYLSARRLRYVRPSLIASVTSIVFAAGDARATPVTVPFDLNPGNQYRLVFISSAVRDGTSADINDYNTFVMNVANSVPQLAALG